VDPAASPPRLTAQRGQSAVELVALLPALALLLVAGWQAVAWIAAWQLAGEAARAGARAAEVGAPAGHAARAVLPGGWAGRVRDVAVDADGGVRVRLAVPGLVPGLPLAGEVRAAAGAGR
jgi:hypothetical protein